LTGFVIAGEDFVYQWADARIEGDSVVLSSPKVPNPVAVRYAWADNPPCSLFNKAGLPAVPFQAQLPSIRVFTSSKDTYIDESKPDENFGHIKYLRIEDEGKPASRRFGLMQWDLSKINFKSDDIDDVVFRCTQIDGPIGDGFDIYAVSVGDWNETELTWNKWNNAKTELVFLGAMRSVSYPDGLTSFSSPTLTDWVRKWIAEPDKNYGLLLKYHYGKAFDGDTIFASGFPEEFYDPPQLIIHTKEKSIDKKEN
jgi:hypothetical protein